MANQAQAAGERADAIINNLANPEKQIVTEQATVDVLDKAQPVQTEPDQGNWENRFKGYKTSADKTIHTLRQKVQQFDLVQQENEQLKERLEEVKTQIPSTPNEMLELFSDEEVAGFTKMVDGRVNGLQEEVSRLQQELLNVRQAEEEAQRLNTHKSLVDTIASAVPNYDSIDKDPAFADWMRSPDQFGLIRYDLLMQAKNSIPPDISRIVQFYLDYANEAQAQEGQETYTQQELLQTPHSAPSARAETPQRQSRVWDQATISQFYKDKAIGKISPSEAKTLEKEMYSSLYKK